MQVLPAEVPFILCTAPQNGNNFHLRTDTSLGGGLLAD